MKIIKKLKVHKKVEENPNPKYSYNSGVCTLFGEPVKGLDSGWLIWQIKHGKKLYKEDFIHTDK